MSGMSDEAVKAATGKDWSQWHAFLDASGAAEKSHKQIALDLHAAGVPGWWAQMVTVGYERMIGRRAVEVVLERCAGGGLSGLCSGEGRSVGIASLTMPPELLPSPEHSVR